MLFINNTKKYRINSKKLEMVVAKFSKHYKLKADISLALIGDATMRRLNLEYRGLNRTTDVLSFPGLNEIIISYPQIKRQALEARKTLEQELVFIFVHGLLHLLGRTDETEKNRQAMILEGEKFIANVL